MSASGTFDVNADVQTKEDTGEEEPRPISEFKCVSPIVEINGRWINWMTPIAIEESVGETPSRALLQLGGAGYDISGPVTLNKYAWPFKPKSRVVIHDDYHTYFRGELSKRSDQGSSDVIMWEAIDDRWLLAQIVVRGALVYDPTTNTTKYLPRFYCWPNPLGLWNCTGVYLTVGNISGVFPVFVQLAEIGKGYEAPIETFSPVLPDDGTITAWTPRRMLQYFWLISHISSGYGINTKHWRHIANSTRLKWNLDSLNIVGRDTSLYAPSGGGQYDPLDRKMSGTQPFDGTRLLSAICTTLERYAGTHGLAIRYEPDASYVWFYPEGISGLVAQNCGGAGEGTEADTGHSLHLVVGGEAKDQTADTIFDFEVHEDYSEIEESRLVEGAVVEVEARLTFDKDKPDEGELRPAWTPEELIAFRYALGGNPDAGPEKPFCWYSEIPGGTDISTFKYADGKDGRPKIWQCTPEASAFARSLFPTVLKGYIVNSEVAWMHEILQGAVSAELSESGFRPFDDENKYPYLHGARPVLPAQLQFFTRQLGNIDEPKTGERFPQPFPVFIEMYNEPDAPEESYWAPAPYASGLRLGRDNIIYLDGLAEEADGADYCTYKWSFKLYPHKIVPRSIRINCAMPLDHRVYGYVEAPSNRRHILSDYAKQIGGPPMGYDGEQSFIEKHQVKSFPYPNRYYYRGEGGKQTLNTIPTGGIDRLLPPGSEREHAIYAAQRVLAYKMHPSRQSQWLLVGVRPELSAGEWIKKIICVGSAEAEREYDVNAPIRLVTKSFIHQHTMIGGLLSNLTTALAGTERFRKSREVVQPGEVRDTSLQEALGLLTPPPGQVKPPPRLEEEE
jgi:hypothetical protein